MHRVAFVYSFILVLLIVIQTRTTGSTDGIANPDTACIDSQLTGAVEYVSTARYKTVGTMKRNFACVLLTQLSADRLPRLLKQMRGWLGATSAAVYIPTSDPAQKVTSLGKIDKFMTKLAGDSKFHGWLTISVLYGNEAFPQLWNCSDPNSPNSTYYPINALRNLAASASNGSSSLRSYVPPYLLYLDVDFVPSVGLSEWINNQARMDQGKHSFYQLTNNGAVIVLPAFESSGAIPAVPTRSLKYITDGIEKHTIRQFHGQRYPAGHGPTDYKKWQKRSATLTSKPQEYEFNEYRIKFSQGYEPYVIMARGSFIPYDERFRGYGYNKVVNLRWFADNHRTFHALPGHFVVEDVHVNSNTHDNSRNYTYFTRAYNKARKDIKAGRMPLISHNTARLLKAAGFANVATEDPVTHAKYLQSVVSN